MKLKYYFMTMFMNGMFAVRHEHSGKSVCYTRGKLNFEAARNNAAKLVVGSRSVQTQDVVQCGCVAGAVLLEGNSVVLEDKSRNLKWEAQDSMLVITTNDGLVNLVFDKNNCTISPDSKEVVG